MLFNSVEYIFVFLPILLSLIYFLNLKIKYTKILIIFFGLVFYSYWNINFLPLILFSIFINYFFSIFLEKYEKTKLLLFISISFNLSLLICFKYLDFVLVNINLLFNLNLEKLNLPFPLAISFYTFQQITFLIDVANKEIKNKNFINYFLFVIFFPQLIAGPIVKYNYLINQFKNKKKKINQFFNRFYISIFIISIGLFKKIILADQLSVVVNYGYENYNYLDFISAWFISFCFAFQFYFDFSGYIDIATGSAFLIGIKLPQNFNSPYKATSIIEFWKRWHMTLTSFLTNYLYTPLAKNFINFSFTKSMLLILFVFLVAGLWHGPSWLFVIFGFMHGIGSVFNHIKNRYFPSLNLNKFFSWLTTFLYLNFTFIFFRSENFNQAISISKSMLGKNHFFENTSHFFYEFDKFNLYFSIFLLPLCFYICLFSKNSYQIQRSSKITYKVLLATILLFIISINFIDSQNEFIYFKF